MPDYPIGSVWEDGDKDEWTVRADGYMYCEVGDYGPHRPEVTNRLYGPLENIFRPTAESNTEDISVTTNAYRYGDIYEDRDGDQWRVGVDGRLCGVGDIAHVIPQQTDRVEHNYGPLNLHSRNGVRVTADPIPPVPTVRFDILGTTTDGFQTRDSGQRQVYSTGMQRDTTAGKSRFDLLVPEDVPYEAQFLTRFADLMERGAQKYDERNWERAGTAEELARFKQSAFRHAMQWLSGADDEDHAAAVAFNLMAYETTKYKMENN